MIFPQKFLTVSLCLNRFSSVTERFFMELNTRRIDTSVARSETLCIINGMRYLKLGVRLDLCYWSVLNELISVTISCMLG